MNINSVIAKLKEVVGCRTDTDLARALGISSSTISTWKARQGIPYELVARVAEERHIPFVWFFAEESSTGDHAGADASGALVPLLSRTPNTLPGDLRPEHVAAHLYLPGIAANSLAVTSSDDALAPRLKEGDVVIFAPGELTVSGDIVVTSNEWRGHPGVATS